MRLKRNPPFGNQIKDSLKSIPCFKLQVEVSEALNGENIEMQVIYGLAEEYKNDSKEKFQKTAIILVFKSKSSGKKSVLKYQREK